MISSDKNTPKFCIIGAQKAGTTWLWNMLKQHPGASLPRKKEIHYFGSAELYEKGDDWYYDHFEGLDRTKLIGEASTTYFYDKIPYWYNESDQIEFDESQPSIPELILQRFPNMKFIVILRDPVHRAISAYYHELRKRAGEMSPMIGLKRHAVNQPKFRIVEFGRYFQYLKTWLDYVPSDQLRILIFEDQIKKHQEQTLTEIYKYLDLDPDYQPTMHSKRFNKSWGWTRLVFSHYASYISKSIGRSRAGALLDKYDFLPNSAIKSEDIEFLRSVYLPEKDKLIELLGNPLSSWDYGETLLR